MNMFRTRRFMMNIVVLVCAIVMIILVLVADIRIHFGDKYNLTKDRNISQTIQNLRLKLAYFIAQSEWRHKPSPLRMNCYDGNNEPRRRNAHRFDKSKPHDPFKDLQKILKDNSFPKIVVDDGAKRSSLTFGMMSNVTNNQNSSYSQKLFAGISANGIYREDDNALVEGVLQEISTLKIVNVSEVSSGTQIKLLVGFDNGDNALMKPMRFGREKQTEPNHMFFVDFERHTSEIAAFHLDRFLGFRRAMPAVGRLINMTSEIYLNAGKGLQHTFYISPATNVCFYGTCGQYCDMAHAICGKPDLVEAVLIPYLPKTNYSESKSYRNPWRRHYNRMGESKWESDPDYCSKIRQIPAYKSGRRLLNIVDMVIIDFLIGNLDRHHYTYFKSFKEESFIWHFDHGRGFGEAFFDDFGALAPLLQCCLIRKETLTKLLKWHNGPVKLSQAMYESLKKDPLNPILWKPHFEALDRRIYIILRSLRSCISIESKHGLYEAFKEGFLP